MKKVLIITILISFLSISSLYGEVNEKNKILGSKK
jgi:hypothetical protein